MSEKIIKIDWKKGFRGSSKGDAEKCHAELEDIRKRDGDLKPEAIVQHAKYKKSGMHGLFTWDDTEAAKQHRLAEARLIMRCIEVVYAKAPNVRVRAYSVTRVVSGNEKSRKVYQSTAELLKDPIAHDELLGRAIREALSFRRKYHGISELAKVFQALDDFMGDAEDAIAV